MPLYFSTDEFQLKTIGTVSFGLDANTCVGGLSLETCKGDRETTAIYLFGRRTTIGGAKRVYTLEIPDLAYSETVEKPDGGSYKTYLRIYDLAVYSNEDGHDWKVTYGGIEWVISDAGVDDPDLGVVEHTFSGGTLYSDIPGHNGIPLIGIYPKLQPVQETGLAPLLPLLAVGTAFDSNIINVFEGGYRYKDDDGEWVQTEIIHRIEDPPLHDDPDCGGKCYGTFAEHVNTPVNTWEVSGAFNLIYKETVTVVEDALECPCPAHCQLSGSITGIYKIEYGVREYFPVSAYCLLPTPNWGPPKYKQTAINACGCLPEVEEPDVDKISTEDRDWEDNEALWCIGGTHSIDGRTFATELRKPACRCETPNLGDPPYDPNPEPCWDNNTEHCCASLSTCFSAPEGSVGGITSDVDFRGILATFWVADGWVFGRLENFATLTLIKELTLSIEADWVHVKWDRHNSKARLRLYTCKDGEVKVYTSNTGGETWDSGTSIGTGTMVTAEITRAGIEYVYWLDGDSIYGQRYDQSGNALEAAYLVTSGADETGFAVVAETAEGGKNRVVLTYLLGGTPTRLVSDDGINFS